MRKTFVNLGAEHPTIVSFVARIALALKQGRTSVNAESMIWVTVICGCTPVFVRTTVIERQAKAKDLAWLLARVDDNGAVVSSPAMDTITRVVANGISASGVILTWIACTFINILCAVLAFPPDRAIAEIIANYIEARGAIVEDFLVNHFVCVLLHVWNTAKLQVRHAVLPREKSLCHLC